MTRKIPDGDKYIRAVTSAIKNDSTARELYKAIYGVEPQRIELQKFSNRLNPARSNPGTDLLGLCIENSKNLREMSLGEFFGIGKDKS